MCDLVQRKNYNFCCTENRPLEAHLYVEGFKMNEWLGEKSLPSYDKLGSLYACKPKIDLRSSKVLDHVIWILSPTCKKTNHTSPWSCHLNFEPDLRHNATEIAEYYCKSPALQWWENMGHVHHLLLFMQNPMPLRERERASPVL